MAIRKIVESDLSGEVDASTVTFGLGDTWYEVDLTADERAQLEEMLGTYVDAGRKAEAPQRKRYVPKTSVEERERIRAWARENGYELADRGFIPKKISRAYNEAHGIDPATP